jgi:hypothetical protein
MWTPAASIRPEAAIDARESATTRAQALTPETAEFATWDHAAAVEPDFSRMLICLSRQILNGNCSGFVGELRN